MKPGLILCSFTTSCLLLFATMATAAECRAYRADTPAYGLDEMFDDMAGTPVASPNDAPYFNNAASNEEGPESYRLLDLWNRDRLNLPMPIVRFGPPDTVPQVEMPNGQLVVGIETWPCLLAPGDQIYVSDGFTDHSSLVYAIDRAGRVLTLLDPRAEESFMLSSKAIFDDWGGSWRREGLRKLLSVPFSTIDALLKEAILGPTRPPVDTLQVASEVFPALDMQLLRYWRDNGVLASLDVAGKYGSYLDYIADLAQTPLAGVQWNYALALNAFVDLRRQGAPLPPQFDAAILDFPALLSKNMNFRILVELIDAGENGRAADFAEAYMDQRGFDLDFAIMRALACHHSGDEACASEMREKSEAQTDDALRHLFRGADLDEDRAMLGRNDYGNTTTLLLRARLSVLDALK